ncbi:hypothetical protein EZS27_008102 [termite gut metagenome]|uniref:Tetratricopeptide repeat protein n=1 Tax=termite gut metagenome TaxID=433724 RepID=A0A5J4SEE0_9ZZZZ
MTPANIQQWITSPELLDGDTLYKLRTALARYPYCQTLRLLYLKNLYILHDNSFGAELRKAALYAGDRCALFYLIEGDKYVFRTDIASADADQTLTLIDSFLSQSPEEVPQVPPMPNNFVYAGDYTLFLSSKESESAELPDTPKLHGHDLIDNFIEKVKDKPLTLKSVEEEVPAEETILDMENDANCFTETLAKIYIKQKKYAKALEIIKTLSVKNPRKNTYFADQIRFLEKLIINTKSL